MRQTLQFVSSTSNEGRKKYVIRHITEVLFKLLSVKRISEISISELCKEAGVGRASFYRNFDSKEDVLKKWLMKTTENFIINSRISFKNDSITDYFIKLFTHLTQYKDICTIFYRAGLIYLIKDEFDRVFIMFYKGIYDEFKSNFLSGGIFNIFLLWLINGCVETPEQLADKLIDIMEK